MLEKIKAQYGLSTDRAGDLKAGVYASSLAFVIMDKIADRIIGMSDGWLQTTMLVLVLAALVAISWLTVGNVAPDAAAKVKDKLGELENRIDELSGSELLEKGREP